MKVAMSISIEAEKAELLRGLAERNGEKLSPFVNRLIDSGLTLERGIFSPTTLPEETSDDDSGIETGDGEKTGAENSSRIRGQGTVRPQMPPDRPDVIESAEEDVADERRSDDGDWPTLNEEMTLSEQVSLCVGDEPRGAPEISGYTGIAEDWVQKHLDQLLDAGTITGRKTSNQWFYWRIDAP